MMSNKEKFTGFNPSTGFNKKQMWSFNLGSYAQWFINSAFTTWVFSFYFSAIGLPVVYIMTAYILWTIWNAINDPLIGYISDHIRTRWGRRKPFIMIGTIPICIIEIILWMPPTNDHFITFIYLLIMLICYDIAYTMIALPYDSLFPELYSSKNERAQSNVIKQVLSTIGLLCAYLIPGFFIGDIENATGYLYNGIITSVIIGITLIVSLKYGVVEREEFSLDHKQEFGFIEGLKYTFKNKGFILYTLMFFLYEYIILMLGVVVPLYGKHILNTGTFETSILLGLMFVVGIATVVIWAKLDVKIGSRKSYGIAMVCYFIASIPLLLADNYIFALITIVSMGFGFGGLIYFIYLLIADVVDEDELKTGVRREGTFFGITNFFMRLAMILSIVTVSLIFSSTGWEEYAPNPGVDVIFGLKFLIVFFPGLALAASGVCLYFYPYPKERVAEIKAQLVELHKTKMEKVKSK